MERKIGGLNIWKESFVEFWVGWDDFSSWVLSYGRKGGRIIHGMHGGYSASDLASLGAFLMGFFPVWQGKDLVGVCLYISATCGFASLHM
jgi:hypothetical protein